MPCLKHWKSTKLMQRVMSIARSMALDHLYKQMWWVHYDYCKRSRLTTILKQMIVKRSFVFSMFPLMRYMDHLSQKILLFVKAHPTPPIALIPHPRHRQIIWFVRIIILLDCLYLRPIARTTTGPISFRKS